MITPELITYIKSQQLAGMTNEQIAATLKANGWMDADIAEGLATLQPVEIVTSQPVQSATSFQQSQPTMQSMNFASGMPLHQEVATENQSAVSSQFGIGMNPHQAQNQTQTNPVMQETNQSIYQGMNQNGYIASQPTIPSSGSRTKKIVLTVMGVIMLIILGGGTYAYVSGYFTPLEKITSQALQATVSAKSASFDITTTIDTSDFLKTFDENTTSVLAQGFLSTKSSITVKGAYDLFDTNNKKFLSTVSINTGTTSASAEIRALSGILYAQLTQAPTIAMLPMLSSLEKQWVSFPYTPSGDMAVPTLIPGVNIDILKTLTPDQLAEFYTITNNAQFIKITKKLDTETIAGVSSYHFMFDLDKQGIVDYLQKVKEYIQEVGKNDSKLSSFDPTITMEDLDMIKDFSGEAWIGKTNKLIHKFSISMTVLDPIIKTEGVKVTSVGIFTDWNKPVTVSAPASSMTFDEFTGKLFSGTDDIVSNESSLRSDDMKKRAVEEYFPKLDEYIAKNKKSTGFCASKDLSSYPEIAIVCRETKNGFIAFSKLDTGNYFCADTMTGFTGEVTTEPKTGSACPKK